MKTAFIYNEKRIKGDIHHDEEAEFDSPRTIQAVEQSLTKAGLTVERIEATDDRENGLLPRLLRGKFEFAFNISEGRYGRAREAQVPAILEFLQIPYAGSDATTIAIAHDKAIAKDIARAAQLPTAPYAVLQSHRDPLPQSLQYPLFVKPIHEGSSKGISRRSLCETPQEQKEITEFLLETYKQPVLVEEFLSGREFSVGIIGNNPPEILGIMESTSQNTEIPWIYDYDNKFNTPHDTIFISPAIIEPGLKEEIQTLALSAFRAFSCRDFTRVDIRLDRRGKPSFLEINPLAGLNPGVDRVYSTCSDLTVISYGVNVSHEELIARIVDAAFVRCGLRKPPQ